MIFLGIGLLVMVLIVLMVAIASPPEQLVRWLTGRAKEDKKVDK
jgi:hypothetical protein